MFCGKCGNQIADGLLFCTRCGAPVEPEEQEKINPSVDVAPVYTESDKIDVKAPKVYKHRTINTKLLLLIVAGILAIAFIVLLILNLGSIGAWLTRTFSDPQTLLTSVYTKSFSNTIDKITGYASESENIKTGKAGEVHIRPGDYLLDTVSYLLYGTQGEAQWFSDIGILFESDTQNAMTQVSATLSFAEKEVLSGQWVRDQQQKQHWISVPQFQEKALSLGTIEADPLELTSGDILSVMAANEEKCRTVTERYTEAFFQGFQSVTRETRTITVGTLSQKTTLLYAHMAEDDLLSVLISIMKHMKNDEELKALIIESANVYQEKMNVIAQGQQIGLSYDPTEAYDKFIQELDLQISELSRQAKSTDPNNYIELYTYLNGNNQITGIELEISGMDEKICFMAVQKGMTLAFSADLADVHMEGGLQIGPTHSGSLTVFTEDERIADITLTDISVKKNGFSATAVIVPSSEFLYAIGEELGSNFSAWPISDISLQLYVEKENDRLMVCASFLDKKASLLDIEYTIASADVSPIIRHEEFVDGTQEEALLSWLQELDVTAILNKLAQAGIPTELLQGIVTQ